MLDLKRFASAELRVNPEQVQIFTPTPSTYSTLMYYTEINPFTRKKMFVEKDNGRKQRQKDIVIPQEKSVKTKSESKSKTSDKPNSKKTNFKQVKKNFNNKEKKR